MDKRPARMARAWGPALVWMAGTFVISHQPVVVIPFGAPDYVAHAVSYSVLGALLIFALSGGHPWQMRWRLVVAAGIIGSLYGVSDEFHQSFVPGRMASLGDILADSVGTFAGACAAATIGTVLRTRNPGTPEP